MITQEDINTYIKLYDVIDEIGLKIFKYIDSNYPILLMYIGCLEYSYFSIINDNFYIAYKDQYEDERSLEQYKIPLEYILNNTWKEYIDNQYQEKLTKMKKYEDDEREKRRKQYEQLKKEFGD